MVNTKCIKEDLVDESIEGLDGKLQVRSINRKELDTLIDKQDFNVKPTIILPDGTTRKQVTDEEVFKDFISTRNFQFEGGDFEDDKSWFLDYEEG